MPKQAPLRLIKRCRLYERRGEWNPIPHVARGLYVLYNQTSRKNYEVVYIGVGGVSMGVARSGVSSRIKDHDENRKVSWTHYSFFEVHDNIGRDEILELEGLLLRIFRHDSRIKLDNVQLGSTKLKALSKAPAWRCECPLCKKERTKSH
ncbi:MAG TPA: hypothetical protein VNW97_12745 [Candidatus Saccharimonadales bacterium]|jgi:hypothetical protein|nr:hypothetical protein [Candidatus Saccharimonadales bacterium]